MPMRTLFLAIFRVLQSNEIHRRYLKRAMGETLGVKAKATRLLGIGSYQTLDAQLEWLRVATEESGERM